MTTPRPGSRAEQRRRTEARILDAAAQAFLTANAGGSVPRAAALRLVALAEASGQ